MNEYGKRNICTNLFWDEKFAKGCLHTPRYLRRSNHLGCVEETAVGWDESTAHKFGEDLLAGLLKSRQLLKF
jgi:hypothetical protein